MHALFVDRIGSRLGRAVGVLVSAVVLTMGVDMARAEPRIVSVCDRTQFAGLVGELGTTLSGSFPNATSFVALDKGARFDPRLALRDDERSLWISKMVSSDLSFEGDGVSLSSKLTLVDKLLAFLRVKNFTPLATKDQDKLSEYTSLLFDGDGAPRAEYMEYTQYRRQLQDARARLESQPDNVTLKKLISELRLKIDALNANVEYDTIIPLMEELRDRSPEYWVPKLRAALEESAFVLTSNSHSFGTTQSRVIETDNASLVSALNSSGAFVLEQPVEVNDCFDGDVASVEATKAVLHLTLSVARLVFKPDVQSLFDQLSARASGVSINQCSAAASIGESCPLRDQADGNIVAIPLGVLVVKDMSVRAAPTVASRLRRAAANGWLTHFGPINLKESTWSVFRQEGKESEVLVESDTELSASDESSVRLTGPIIVGLYFTGLAATR
ncbi:hypothetical protein [Sinorhizobium medicae]